MELSFRCVNILIIGRKINIKSDLIYKAQFLIESLFESVSSFYTEFSVPLSSLALLVPPLRLMSAVMWEVVRQRNIKHYGKLEEFVSMVTDAVPELMSKREGRLLSLGLRARVSRLKCPMCL